MSGLSVELMKSDRLTVLYTATQKHQTLLLLDLNYLIPIVTELYSVNWQDVKPGGKT